MKGIIPHCLSDLVKEKFGKDQWEAVLNQAGLDKHAIFWATTDIDDKIVLNVVEAACQVLHLSMSQAADAFGDYWVNVYAPKTYALFYQKAHCAKDLLLMTDAIHHDMTANLPNAHPPHFDYAWKNRKTLLMTYKSPRGLIDFVVGLAKGVGKYYHEPLKVRKINQTTVEIIFPKEQEGIEIS